MFYIIAGDTKQPHEVALPGIKLSPTEKFEIDYHIKLIGRQIENEQQEVAAQRAKEEANG